MELNLEYVYEKIMPLYDTEDFTRLADYIESIEFKYNKSYYHLLNLMNKIDAAMDFEQEDYYEKIYNPLYFELESFLIGIRTTVDITMHVLNESLDCKIEKNHVNLGSVYKSTKLTKAIKNVLHRYTHNRDSSTWSFIYQNRNEVVHEKGVNQILPITIDFFQGPKPVAYFEVEGEQRNINTFLENCLNFLKRFITHLFESLIVTLEYKKRNTLL